MIYNGECEGGPYAGKRLAHDSKCYPIVASPLADYSNLDVLEIGEYIYEDGIWIWDAWR